MSFEQRKRNVPEFVIKKFKDDILQAFREFDKNNDQKIDADEIMIAMKSIGTSITKEQAV